MTAIDREHLRILAICHYILGALCFVFGAIPIIYIVIGIAIVTGAVPPQPQGPRGNAPPPPELIGWVFIGSAAVAMLFCWSLAVALVVAGRNLSRQKSWVFCLIVAGGACLYMPLGTILGVFTFIVLMRPSVKAAFGGSHGAASRDGAADEDRSEFDTYHTE